MNLLFFLISLIIVTGCEQKSQARHYTEVAIETPTAAVPFTDPHAGLDISSATMATDNTVAWNAPQGWVEESGKGLRLATFHDTTKPQDVDVSIVPLGGSMAGGLESNLKRWLGQINVQVPDAQLQFFMQSSRDNIFDFSQLQKDQSPSVKSMMVSIISLQDKTVFIKMTGSIEAINRHKKEFMDLVKSVHSKPGLKKESLPADHPPMGDTDNSMPAMMLPTANSTMEGKLTWVSPAGWQEQPSSGMRLATFRLASAPQKIDCYIVTLGGMAGGLEANLSRWMGQIGLSASAESLQQLINSSQSLKTQSGQEAKIYDFISIQKNASTSDKSMIAAIISMPEVSIFVKMTGSIEAVSQNRNSFLELVKSLRHQ